MQRQINRNCCGRLTGGHRYLHLCQLRRLRSAICGQRCELVKWLIGLKLADGTHKGLLFNADGTFNKALEKYHKGAKLTKVEVSALPAAITSYTASTYADYTIKAAGTNEAGEYFLVIAKTTGTEEEIKASRKVLQFNADGTFKQETTPPAHPDGPKGKRRKH
jgi:hypothetical protein